MGAALTSKPRNARWAALVAAPLALGVLEPSAAALAAPSPTLDCPIQAKDGATFLSLDRLDPRIAAELGRRFAVPGAPAATPLMAPRDAAWQVTDVMTPGAALPGRRVIQGGRDGNRWYVWYESGGIAHAFHATIFDLPPAAPAPRVLAHHVGSLDQLCPVTRAALADHGPGQAPPEPGFW